jgi:hypothetical protein
MASKHKIMGTVVGLALATGSFAEEAKKVEASKAAPMTSILPNFYSSVQLRQGTSVAETGDSHEGTSTFVQGRYVLGSKFLDGALDANITLGATKATQSSKITQRRTYGWLALTAVEGDHGSITPYADIRLPAGGSGTEAHLGISNSVNTKSFETLLGKITLSANIDHEGIFGSRDTKTQVTGLSDDDKAKFALAGEDKDQVAADAAPMTTEAGAHIAFEDLAGLKGLNLETVAFVDRSYSANMEKTEINGEERIAMTGYTAVNSSYNYYNVSYALGTSGVKLMNETWQYFDGVYAHRKNGSDAAKEARWSNVFRVSKAL